MPKRNSRQTNETAGGPRKRSGLILAPAGLVALAVVALAVVTRPASPQLDSTQTQPNGGPQAAATPQPDPPGTIDGSKSPDLIPDEAAYRVVFIAFAEPENATVAQRARFHAKVLPAGLSKDDEQAFFTILTAFRKKTDDLHEQVSAILARNPTPHPDSTDYEELLEIDRQATTAFDEAMAAVPARLNQDGVAKLGSFIKSQKHGMKYLPDMVPPK